jgi:hypothetical protein
MTAEPRVDELPLGTVLEGKYRLDRVIGRGGMGSVYEARHLLLDARVAVKVLSGAMVGRGDLIKRTIREAKIISALGHPNIVSVTDLGWHGELPFLVMEYLVGSTVDAELEQRGPMTPAAAVEVTVAVLDALEVVHRRGIVHRDIKPLNVMVARDGAGHRVTKVLDFGIAKLNEGEDGATKTAFVMGTPTAMSPEQALGESVDGRTDLFAVGELLYTMLVGRSPYHAPNTTAALARLLDGRFTPASECNAAVPKAMDEVIARALARRPEDRFASAAAMREAVHAALEPAPASASARAASPAVGTARAASPGAGARAASPAAGARAGAPAVARPGPAPAHATSASDPLDAPTAPRKVDADPFAPPPIERLPIETLLDRPPAIPATPPRAKRSAWPWLVALVAVAGAAAWIVVDPTLSPTIEAPRTVAVARPPAPGDPVVASDESGGPTEPIAGDPVLLMITTKPANAKVWIDDVLMARNPTEVPRSSTWLQVRVEAPGFTSRVVQVQPLRSRQLEVVLERVRK